jgi:hypothetical protein
LSAASLAAIRAALPYLQASEEGEEGGVNLGAGRSGAETRRLLQRLLRRIAELEAARGEGEGEEDGGEGVSASIWLAPHASASAASQALAGILLRPLPAGSPVCPLNWRLLIDAYTAQVPRRKAVHLGTTARLFYRWRAVARMQRRNRAAAATAQQALLAPHRARAVRSAALLAWQRLAAALRHRRRHVLSATLHAGFAGYAQGRLQARQQAAACDRYYTARAAAGAMRHWRAVAAAHAPAVASLRVAAAHHRRRGLLGAVGAWVASARQRLRARALLDAADRHYLTTRAGAAVAAWRTAAR